MNTDRLKELAETLSEALADAEDASEALRRATVSAHKALGEINGILGSTDGKRDRDPGTRKRLAMQLIHVAGGAYGGEVWADRQSLKAAATSLATQKVSAGALVSEALRLAKAYADRQGETGRRLTGLGEQWREPH